MSTDEPEDDIAQAGWVEATGKTVAEATAAASAMAGASSADEVEVEVLEEPQRGLLGIGGREARVRVRLKADKSRVVVKLVEDALRVLGLGEAEVDATLADDGYLRVGVTGPNLGVLIGRRGETLDALQYLLNLAAARLPGASQRVILDVGGYRERRRVTLEHLAERVIETVRRTGREMALEPMTPQERKVIHLFVAAQEGVQSESRGEEPFRRIVISTTGAGSSAGPSSPASGGVEPWDDEGDDERGRGDSGDDSGGSHSDPGDDEA